MRSEIGFFAANQIGWRIFHPYEGLPTYGIGYQFTRQSQFRRYLGSLRGCIERTSFLLVSNC